MLKTDKIWFYLATSIFIMAMSLQSIYAQNTCMLKIKIEGVRNSTGFVRGTVFNSAEGFPSKPKHAVEKFSLPAGEFNKELVLKVSYGTYAIALLHDENGDAKMNLSFVGIPKEGFSSSGEEKGILSFPNFDNSKVVINKPEQTLVLEMKYAF